MSRGNATIPFLYFTPPLDDMAGGAAAEWIVSLAKDF